MIVAPRRLLPGPTLAALLGGAPLCGATMAEDGYRRLDGHGGPVHAITVSQNGIVASGGFDNGLLFRPPKGEDRFVGDAHDAAVKSVRGVSEGFFLSAGDDFRAHLWEFYPDHGGWIAKRVSTFKGHEGAVADAAAAHGDGMLGVIATAGWDGRIGLWRVREPEGARLDWLTGHRGPVQAVSFADNDQTLYSASSDGTIRSWNVAERAFRRVEIENGFGVNVLALDEDAGWLAFGAVDGAVKIIDRETGAQIADFTTERQPVLAIDYHKDAQRLAVGDGEGHIHVIDTATWTTLRDFRAAPKGPVWALAFDREGTHLYAGTLANHIDVWPIASTTGVAQADAPFREFHRDPTTMSNGERQFARKCSICHTLTEGGGRRAGPSLYGVFGRRAGTLEDYTYSAALKDSDLVWDEISLDKLFDLGPEHYTPGSKMPMQRIVRGEDRADLIDYLRTATRPAAREGE